MNSLIAGVRVDLENTERIPLGVDEVALPARLRDCELGQRDNAALLPDCRGGGVKVLNLERADKGIRPRLRRRRFGGRCSKPPREPPVSIVQYGMGTPLTSENFQPKIWE